MGDRVKVQNNASLYEGVEIEDGAFIGPHVVFTNDKVPRAVNPDGTLKSHDDWQLGSTTVCDGAAVGAGAVIVTGVRIGSWAMVGSGSVVTRDVPDHALVAGNPARVIGWVSAAGERCGIKADAVQRTAQETGDKSTVIGIGVVGYGYWGPNLVRNFAQVDDASVVAVCDSSPARRAAVEKRYPGVQARMPICTRCSPTRLSTLSSSPRRSRRTSTSPCKRSAAGKHVLVEKPFTATVAEGEELIEVAERVRPRAHGRPHVRLHRARSARSPSWSREATIGRLQYYDSVRVNLGLFQRDVSVLWDLAVHDLSIMDFITGRLPAQVAATGMSHLPGRAGEHRLPHVLLRGRHARPLPRQLARTGQGPPDDDLRHRRR